MDYIFNRFTENTNSQSNEGSDIMSSFLIFLISSNIIYVIYKFAKEFLNQRNESNSGIRNNNTAENHNLEDDCPICHENFKNAVELDCSHVFCAKCIMDYYKTIKPNLLCPMCRKNIRLINVLKDDKSEESKPYKEMIVMFNHEHLTGYNYYLNLVTNFPFLFSHGIKKIISDPTKLVIYLFFGILVIAYFLSPIDVIPDYLSYIGYLDDFIVVLAFVYGIMKSFYSAFNELNESEFQRYRRE